MALTRFCTICLREFKTYPSRVKQGRGKYCSRKCSDEVTLIKKGEHRSSETEIRKGEKLPKEWVEKMRGRTPWNKGKGTKVKKMGGVGKNIKGRDLREVGKATRIKKGEHLSPATEFKKGNRPKHAGKKRLNMCGEKHWNWKGGRGQRPVATIEYKNWRQGVFERDNYTCQMCDRRGGDLNADHIKPWALHEKLRYNVSNGRTLCVKCHKEITFGVNAHPRDGSGQFIKIAA